MQKERGEEDKTKTKESEMVKRRIREVIANKSRAWTVVAPQTLIIKHLLRRGETMTDASAKSEEGYATQDDYAN